MTPLNDLQRLREFVQIADSGGISRAARVLGLSQPTLSRHLATLEKDLGSPLVRRDTHAMSLTQAGKAVLADARELLASADRLGRRLHSERSALRGHLRVVSVVDVGQWVVSRVLSQFSQLHPHVTAELHLINRPTKFSKEGFDCGILFGGVADRRVVMRPVAELGRRLVAAPSLLRKHPALNSPADLRRLPWMGVLQPHFYARDRVELIRGEESCRVMLDPVLLLDSVTALREAALEGAGFTLQPDWLVASDIAGGRLVEVLPEWRLTPGALQIAWSAGGHLPHRLEALIAFLMSEIPLHLQRAQQSLHRE